MSMSDIRKKAQDKLRRKYGYSTNTNYGRGVILYRQDSDSHELHSANGDKIVHDLNICVNNRIHDTQNQVEFHTTQYIDHGEDAPEDGRYEQLHNHTIYFSAEEFDLLATVIHQMAEENDWKDQIQHYKSLEKRRS